MGDGTRQARTALVVGGGIGGMATAAALGRRGVEVDVVEIRPELHLAAGGVGLGQSANALRALDALGVLEACMDEGYVFDRIRLFDDTGRLVTEHVFKLGDDRVPAFCSLPRAHLHAQLAEAALSAGARVFLSDSVQALEQDPGGVTVVFRGGATKRYDVVIGFDGIRSQIRRLLFGERFEPVSTGFGAWRILAPRGETVTSMENYSSVGSKVAVLPVNEHSMYLSRLGPEPSGVFFDQADRPELLRLRMQGYGGVPGSVREAISVDSTIVYSELEVVPIPPEWSMGRVVIAGDAAHAGPPHLTQGAAMALEDAVVLAQVVTDDLPVVDALKEYTRRRRPRCEFVQRTSCDILATEQSLPSTGSPAEDKDFLAREFGRKLEESDGELNRDAIGVAP